MMETCITIDSSDEDDIKIMDTPVIQAKPGTSEEVKRKVPLLTVETGKSIFTALLSACKNADPSSEMDIIVNKMWKRFHEADSSYTSSTTFIEFVKSLIPKAPTGPFCQLKCVSDDLKFHRTRATTSESVAPGPSTTANSNETDIKTLRNISKLEKLVAKLQRKIDYLEGQEVDLHDSNDDENSAYIQVSRYKLRICDVYKKLCELRKTDTYNAHLLRNIKFSGTKIPAVNRAIERFYNETREFPDFREVLTIVEKANDLKNLGLLPPQCHETAVQAFKELGETLKRHRQSEDMYSLEYFLGNRNCDPASESQLLEQKLQENKRLYGNRIDEVIDKYAKKQIEEKLEPEDVPDDAASESDSDDEEEADEVSSTIEVESNAADSSADEDDKMANDSDAEPEEPFEARELRVVLPDLREMPEWAAYLKSERERRSAPNCAAAVCQPLAGCSKDVVDDYCVPCANKTPPPSSLKRSRAMMWDDDADDGIESRAKVASDGGALISVDLTADSPSTKSAGRRVEPTFVEDPLGWVKASGSRLPNGMADASTDGSSESAKPQSFVVVDVESILAGNAKFARNRAQNGTKVEKRPPPKTESLVTRKDVGADGVSIRDPGLQDHLKTLTKNGIKILNVSSKKDSSGDEKSKGSRKHAEDGTKVASNGINVKENCEIIDLEEAVSREKTAQSTKSLSSEPKNLPTFFTRAVPLNTNEKAKPFSCSSYQEPKKTANNCPSWPKFSPGCNRLPTTSTPKPSPHIPSRPFLPGFQVPPVNRPSFGPRPQPSGQRHPMSQPRFSAPFGSNGPMRGGPRPPMPPRPQNVYPGPNASVRRTVQTTQKFFKGSNVYTQTMTVVQEMQMQPQPGNVAGMRSQSTSNGPVGRGGSRAARFGVPPTFPGATQSSSSSSNRKVPPDPRQNMKRKNSADVITLE